MKKKTIVIIRLYMMTLLCLCISFICQAQFAGGSGTVNDPYLVETAEQLNSIRNHLIFSYRQIADIDLGIPPYNEGQGWEPIAGGEDSRIKVFIGIYDGNGFTISGLTINRPGHANQGLFASTIEARIHNVRLVDFNITSRTHAGGLAGSAFKTTLTGSYFEGVVSGRLVGGAFGRCEDSTIENCTFAGKVEGDSSLGGLVGEMTNSKIMNSLNTGTVRGGVNAGGLVGKSISSEIYHSGNQGLIECTGGQLGGLVGESRESIIKFCYNTGAVSSKSDKVGGLIGYSIGVQNESEISYCFNTGTVSSSGNNIGGLVGHTSRTVISNCFSTGSVNGYRYIGGLVGGIWSTKIENSYSVGTVTSLRGSGKAQPVEFVIIRGGNPYSEYIFTGGLTGIGVADERSSVINSYWNIDASGQTESSAGQGMTNVEMLQKRNYQGWRFDSRGNPVWSILEGASYPVLTDLKEYSGYLLPAPYNLRGAAIDRENTLQWEEPPNNPLGYRIYRNNIPLNREELHKSLSYTDKTAGISEDNSYYVKAVYVLNGEHKYSLPSGAVILRQGEFAGGQGTKEDPFKIDSPESLDKIRHFPEAHFIQTADIDLDVPPWNEQEGWVPIGSSVEDSFKGSFDGNGYLITGLIIDRFTENNQGLFGYTLGAEITRVGLVDVNIVGNRSVGALVAFATDMTIISRSFSTGKVSGVAGIAGLVGFSQNRITVDNCYSFTECFSYSGLAAGLIGGGSYTVSNSFSAAKLITNADFSRSRLYHRGTNCYWNIEAAGQQETNIGEARTTEQMTYPYCPDTYVDWDFEQVWGEDIDGTKNSGYPYFLHLRSDGQGSH